jgi:hypothetical protein
MAVGVQEERAEVQAASEIDEARTTGQSNCDGRAADGQILSAVLM